MNWVIHDTHTESLIIILLFDSFSRGMKLHPMHIWMGCLLLCSVFSAEVIIRDFIPNTVGHVPCLRCIVMLSQNGYAPPVKNCTSTPILGMQRSDVITILCSRN